MAIKVKEICYKTHDEYMAAWNLISAGKHLGSGVYGTVRTVPGNTRRVQKIFVRDRAYLSWINEVGLEADNRYFPKIYSVTRYSHDDYYYFHVVEMERLLPYTKVSKDIRKRVFTRLGWKEQHIRNDYSYKDFSRFKPTILDAKKLKRVLMKCAKRHSLDLHSGNIMFRRAPRGFTPVFTDPIV